MKFKSIRKLKLSVIRRLKKQGVDLRGVDLQGVDLRGVDLRGAYLRGVDLRGAYLRGVDLRGVDLQGVDLRGVNLRGAYLRGVDLRGAYLRDVDLRGVDLQGVDLRDCIGNSMEIKTIQTEKWAIILTVDTMSIGCEKHLIKTWFNFSGDTISNMDSDALEFWKKWKPILKLITGAV